MNKTNLIIPENIIYIHYLKEKYIYIYNQVNKKEYKIMRRAYDYLKDIEDLTLIDSKMIRHLRQCGILEEYSDNIGLKRSCDLDIPLRTIQIEITHNCNFNCVHCYLKSVDRKNNFNLEKIYDIVDQASEIGVFEIDITGGEPLLFPELPNILKYIYKKGMRTRIYTNGYLIDENWINLLKSINLYCVRISIDGDKPSIHDNIRNYQSFERICYNIKLLQKSGINIEISTVVMKTNLMNISNIIHDCKKWKVLHFVDSYLPNKYNKKDNLYITEDEYADSVIQKFEKTLKDESNRKYHCGIGFNFLFIDSNGECKLCPTLPDNLNIGNIYKNTLKNIWISYMNKKIEYICKYYDTCTFNNFCDGGCRNRALIASGDLYGCDTYMYTLLDKRLNRGKIDDK